MKLAKVPLEKLLRARITLEELCDLVRILNALRVALEEILVSLNSFEKNLPGRKSEAIFQIQEDHKKWADDRHGGFSPDIAEREIKEAVHMFDEVLPRLTCYNALIAAAAAMEFFVSMLGHAIMGKKKHHRAVVQKLAKKADMDCSQYHNFHEVRNALVHTGGIAIKMQQQEAAKALGFSLSRTWQYPDDSSDGQQIIIDHATLKKCIVELHKSIVQFSVGAAGSNSS